MATGAGHTQRRNQVLSRERIISTAIEILDTGGEEALTVRALTGRMATGSGAIYYHVGNRDELLNTATERLISSALAAAPVADAAPPAEEIRTLALNVFDAITDHQWLATRLALQIIRNPMGPVTVGLFERIGRQVDALGVPQHRWFQAASTLVHYILGAITQNARIEGDPSELDPEADRESFLDEASAAWNALDPDEFPFMHAIAGQMRDHRDRDQFLIGITIVLDGLSRLR